MPGDAGNGATTRARRPVQPPAPNAETCAFNARRAAQAALEAGAKAADVAKGLKLGIEAEVTFISRLCDEAAEACRRAEKRALAADHAGARRAWQDAERHAARALCAERRFRSLGSGFVALQGKIHADDSSESTQAETTSEPPNRGRFSLLEID